MKKTLLSLIILCIAALGAFAQGDNDNIKIGAGVEAGVAIGPQSSTYVAASGVAFKLQVPVNSSPLNLTLTAGYTGYVTKGGFSTGYNYNTNYGSDSYTYGHIASFIPVEVGARYYLTDRIFAEGDVGASFSISNTVYQDDNTDTSVATYHNAKKVALIYAPIVGYSFPIRSSAIDLSLRYESRVETVGSFNQIAFRASFNFGL